MKAKFAIAATDSNRRLAIIDILNKYICVEPPPESANTISEAISALLKADIQEKFNINGNISQSISQNINQLYRRTQTVQLYRDTSFALCQSAINGTMVIDPATKAALPPKVKNTVVEQINELKDNKHNALVLDIKNTGYYGLKTIDALNERQAELRSSPEGAANVTEKELETIIVDLSQELHKAEYKSGLEENLQMAFINLEKELPLFYETEKLRFIVELGKPVDVCKTEVEYNRAENADHIVKKTTTCEPKTPENTQNIIKEYVKALKTNTNEN